MNRKRRRKWLLFVMPVMAVVVLVLLHPVVTRAMDIARIERISGELLVGLGDEVGVHVDQPNPDLASGMMYARFEQTETGFRALIESSGALDKQAARRNGIRVFLPMPIDYVSHGSGSPSWMIPDTLEHGNEYYVPDRKNTHFYILRYAQFTYIIYDGVL